MTNLQWCLPRVVNYVETVVIELNVVHVEPDQCSIAGRLRVTAGVRWMVNAVILEKNQPASPDQVALPFFFVLLQACDCRSDANTGGDKDEVVIT